MNRNSRNRLALLGAVSATLVSCGLAASAQAATFSNTARISIPAGAPVVREGNADTYPSALSVSGVTGTVTKVTATLHGFEHTFPQDVDILLVGPQGQSTYLMSDAGDTSGAQRDPVELTFDDSANPLPCQSWTVTLPGGTYRPTNDPTLPEACTYMPDTFTAPAPAGEHGAALSIFNGIDPNGTWNLFIVDDDGNDYGSIGGGWSLDFTIAPPTVGQPSVAGAAEVGKTLTATSGPVGGGGGATSYQWSRCDLAGGACAAIDGAGNSSYVPSAADRGHTLIVTQTAANSGGSASASSAPTAAVGPAIVSSAGTKRVQRVLRQRGLIALATSNIGGGLAASATVSIGGASKIYRFKAVSKALAPGVGTKARLKLSKRALSRVRSALNRDRKLTAKLSLTVTDANSAKTTMKLSIRLWK